MIESEKVAYHTAKEIVKIPNGIDIPPEPINIVFSHLSTITGSILTSSFIMNNDDIISPVLSREEKYQRDFFTSGALMLIGIIDAKYGFRTDTKKRR